MFTTEERDQLKAAVMALARGERIATVNYAGPPARSVNYAPAELNDLRSLLASAEADVSAANKKSYRLAAFSKGF